jgi:NitT/TauT family transport system substrate-binding protein
MAMSTSRFDDWRRRDFLTRSTLGGVAGLLGVRPERVAAELPPETTTIRLYRPLTTGICVAPQLVAEELMKTEGFIEVQHSTVTRAGANRALAAGDIDLTLGFGGGWIRQVDAGDPIVILGGGHVGCFELFASDRIRTVRDLKGKAIGVTEIGSGRHLFLLSLLSYIGMDPSRDVALVTKPPAECVKLFAAGQLDAYQAFAEETQELRARKIGHVIMNSTADRPWSQYFCCMLAGNRDFVRKQPIATKRAMRAILKASSVCALEPERVARQLIDRGFTAVPPDHVRDMLQGLPYLKWREYDPDDTIRFYSVRLHEVGIVKATPQKILANGTDWRFLNELKKELKGVARA